MHVRMYARMHVYKQIKQKIADKQIKGTKNWDNESVQICKYANIKVCK